MRSVDADTHIVVAHEVINLGHDRTSLASMGEQARDATGADTLTVLADRGYFSGPEVLACEKARRRGDLPQATNLRRQGRGALRQAGLRLPTRH